MGPIDYTVIKDKKRQHRAALNDMIVSSKTEASICLDKDLNLGKSTCY